MDRYLPELQTSQSQIETGEWLRLWSLDPNITFLNHGSFGACPIAVLKHQQSLRAQMEAAPVRFFAMELEALLDEARQALAHFVGALPARHDGSNGSAAFAQRLRRNSQR